MVVAGIENAALDKLRGLRYIENIFFEVSLNENQWLIDAANLCDFHGNECSLKWWLRQDTKTIAQMEF